MLHIGCWVWGSKYPGHYIDRLAAAVKRNLTEPYRFHIWKPVAEDEWLTKTPGCFARLRAFDPEWQAAQGIEPGDRLVVTDLDMVVAGPLDGLFARAEPFVILKNANVANFCTMNGSVWMLRAGYRPDVWSSFSWEAAQRMRYWKFPDDQAWFEHKMPNAGGWECGASSGIWAFAKKTWPKDNSLPPGARIVAFPGSRDPSMFEHLPWVQNHWSA